MNTGLKRLAIRLVVALLLLNWILASKRVALSAPGGKIDLFTQKSPSGKGLNMPSESFAPGENVTIYALVTYNDYPVSGSLVSFSVQGPKNSVQNITQTRVSQTNESGIASIYIRLGWISEIYFGEWLATGNVRIADSINCQDTLSFRVGWIVNITSIQIVDENLSEQKKFTRGSQLGVKLTLQSIAMTERNVTVTLTIHDELDIPVKSVIISDLTLPPLGILVYPHFLTIPDEPVIGEAVIYASAYTIPVNQGGIPYCPEVSESFYITIRDITILSVETNRTLAYHGEIVNINVTAGNKGLETESFNLNVYYNETIMDTTSVLNVPPGSNSKTNFIWNTSQVKDGKYRISAYAEPVSGETEILDNLFLNGFIKVASIGPDVAVIAVEPSNQTVYVDKTTDVNVTVKNMGSFVESCKVVVYYDLNVAGTLSFTALKTNTTETLTFHWDLEGVAEGNYTLSAFATPIEGEREIDDNYLEDGIIEVRAVAGGLSIPFWFWWLLLLLALILLVLAIWMHRRKKRKKSEENFYSGWTAWYYCHDPRKRDSKIHYIKKFRDIKL